MSSVHCKVLIQREPRPDCIAMHNFPNHWVFLFLFFGTKYLNSSDFYYSCWSIMLSSGQMCHGQRCWLPFQVTKTNQYFLFFFFFFYYTTLFICLFLCFYWKVKKKKKRCQTSCINTEKKTIGYYTKFLQCNIFWPILKWHLQWHFSLLKFV